MSAIIDRLRDELKDPEYSEGYAESFLDSYIATQIKVLREQAGLSQQGLAQLLGTGQGVISRIENVNYSKWNVSTLKKLARAFRVRLKISFETYGSLLADVGSFSRDALQRQPRELDPLLHTAVPIVPIRPHVSMHRRRRQQTPQLHRMASPTAFTGANRVMGISAQLAATTTRAELAQRDQ
jgi:transcriptional regulator with XRE-family HTH domain